MNTNTPKPIRLLILGTGAMAGYHAMRYKQIPGVELVAGVDVNAAQLAEFNKKHEIAHGFTSVEEAIAWGQFDAVSNVTPDRFHYSTTLPLLAAGKPILCEKPLATNAADAAKMAETAAAAGVVNGINLSYRGVGSMQKAAEMVRDGVIGEVRFFEASYLQDWLHSPSQDWKVNPSWLWRLSSAHGSKGSLGDIGVHIIDFATYVAGLSVTDVSCRFAIYNKAPPDNKIGEYVFDVNDTVTMQLSLTNGALGTVSATRVATGHGNDLYLRIYGTKGGIELSNQEPTTLRAHIGDDPKWQTIECPAVSENYPRFIATLRGEKTLPMPDFARGVEIQRILDAAEESASQRGLTVSL